MKITFEPIKKGTNAGRFQGSDGKLYTKEQVQAALVQENGDMGKTLADLQGHLFSQMERLQNTETKGDDLTEELRRSKAVAQISGQMINNARLVLDAQKAIHDRLMKPNKMIGVEGYDEEEA